MRQALSGRRSFLLMLAIVLVAPQAVGALGLELEVRYWAPTLSGAARFPELEIDPDIDVGQLLGLDSDDVVEGRFTFRPGLGIFLRAAYQSMSATGQRSVQDIVGLPISIEGEVSSSLDFDYGRLALGWQFVSPKKVLRIGPFIEAKGFSGEAAAAIRSPLLTDAVGRDFDAAFGSVGALFELQPSDKLQVFAEASFLVGEESADMTDGELGLRFYPIDLVGVGAGYRVMDLDGEIDDVRLDVDWDGFFLSAVLRF